MWRSAAGGLHKLGFVRLGLILRDVIDSTSAVCDEFGVLVGTGCKTEVFVATDVQRTIACSS